MSAPKEFTLKAEHLTLLKAAELWWDDSCYGAPAIDSKRPYGNSSVTYDVAELLGWDIDERDGLTDEQRENADTLHRETLTALQIILATESFALGTYRGERGRWEFVL